jgi:hypothetical protein
VALARVLRLHARIPHGLAAGLLAAVVAGSTDYQIRHYLRFLANEIEARSLMANLAVSPEAARTSVFGVVTRLPSFHATHQIYSWSYYLRDALGGDLSRIAFMEGDIDLDASRQKRYRADEIRAEARDWWFRLYGLNVPTDGAQATLLIEPGPGRRGISDRRLLVRYLRTKWFAAEKLDEFLRSVTSIKVIPKA